VFGANVVGSDICRGVFAAAGFLVCSSGDPVVDPPEVSLCCELCYEIASIVPLSGSSYPVDGQKALRRGRVVSIGDFVRSIVEFADG
jgi:hypothetical protein